MYVVQSREFIIVENIRLVRLIDLTADFGVKTNSKLTPNCQLREKRKTGIHNCLYTVTSLTTILARTSTIFGPRKLRGKTAGGEIRGQGKGSGGGCY